MKNEKFESLVNNIYELSIKGYWDLKPRKFLSSILGFIFIGGSSALFIINLFSSKGVTGFIISISLFVVGCIMMYPIIRIVNNSKKYGLGRSKKFKEELVKQLQDNKPENKKWEDYYQIIYNQIDTEINKRKNERDGIFLFLKQYTKLLTLPFTAIILKTFTLNMAIFFTVFSLIIGIEISLFIWQDYEFLETLRKIGIKNNYKLSVVKRQIEYAEKNNICHTNTTNS